MFSVISSHHDSKLLLFLSWRYSPLFQTNRTLTSLNVAGDGRGTSNVGKEGGIAIIKALEVTLIHSPSYMTPNVIFLFCFVLC
jgi:hypothetical protein